MSRFDAPIPVIGAGPTGLTLGTELLMRGVPCEIYERAEGPRLESRSFTLHARTLELFGPARARDFLALGTPSVSMDYRFRRTATQGDVGGQTESVVRLRYDALADTRYPFVLIINQDNTEQVLRDRFLSLGGRIHWQRKLESATPEDGGVVATIRNTADGSLETVRSGWLVGCDGVYSTTRESLGAEFAGEQYTRTRMRMMDVPLRGFTLGDNRIHYFIHPDRMLLIARLPNDTYRVLISDAGDPADTNGAADVTLEAFQAVVDEHLPGEDVSLGVPSWGPHAFTLGRRLSAGYRVGPILLAGDAAHAQSIIGGQGMNVATHDAFNLGWKLALAWKLKAEGRLEAAEQLLDSYQRERRAVGQQVLDATHQLHTVIMGHGSDGATLEQRLATAQDPEFTASVPRQIAGLSYHYRHAVAPPPGLTPLPGLSAGDRVPDIDITTGPTRVVRLHDLLSDYFTLLVFPSDPESTLAAWVQQAAQPYRGWLQVVVIAMPEFSAAAPTGAVIAEGDAILDTFGPDSLCLVRPDKYVAARCASMDKAALFAMLEAQLPALAGPTRPTA